MRSALRIRKMFICGMRSLIAPQQSSQNKIKSILSKSDKEALMKDWNAVGKDFRLAMEKYTK